MTESPTTQITNERALHPVDYALSGVDIDNSKCLHLISCYLSCNTESARKYGTAAEQEFVKALHHFLFEQPVPEKPKVIRLTMPFENKGNPALQRLENATHELLSELFGEADHSHDVQRVIGNVINYSMNPVSTEKVTSEYHRSLGYQKSA